MTIADELSKAAKVAKRERDKYHHQMLVNLGLLDNEDSRLLDAAPHLLAACQQALLAIQDNLKMYAYKNEQLLYEAFQACKAAIFMATPGETPHEAAE